MFASRKIGRPLRRLVLLANGSSERPSTVTVALAPASSRIVGARSTLETSSSERPPAPSPGPRMISGTRIEGS